MFKRRDSRSIPRVVAETFWPKGGWGRAFSYVKHRLRRLPDPPHRIARGIAAGVVITFTPFFGFHFVFAALLGWIMRGNLLAAMLTTFLGNPLTFPIIATVNLQLGTWLLGGPLPDGKPHRIVDTFAGAMGDLWYNFLAIFTRKTADWSHLGDFYRDVFLPYLVGGIIPGTVLAVISYYVFLPVLIAYQNRRKGRFKERLDKIRRKQAQRADEPGDPH